MANSSWFPADAPTPAPPAASVCRPATSTRSRAAPAPASRVVSCPLSFQCFPPCDRTVETDGVVPWVPQDSARVVLDLTSGTSLASLQTALSGLTYPVSCPAAVDGFLRAVRAS